MSDAPPPPGADDFIRFAGVKKSFGANIIYDDLTLSIRRGETMAILGASGTGKSVALKLLIGLLAPDGGSIRFDGQEIVGLDDRRLLPVRRRISMLFQGGALFDSLSAAENVAYPLREHLRLSEREIADRVAERLEMVGLPGIEDQRPADLSGGMRKRLALARAIAADPEVVLYDEPTTGLDPANTRRISELIRSVQERLKMTSIVVTHDMPSAFMVSDRMAMLHDRRIIATLPAAEFLRADLPAIRDFVTAMPPIEVPASPPAPPPAAPR